MATKRNPVRVKPFCSCMTTLSVDESPDPAEIVEIPPDHESLADDVRLGDEPPIAAVAAAVAVVSHQKEMSRRDLARKTVVIVGAIFPQGKRPDPGQMYRRHIGLDQNGVIVLTEQLAESLRSDEGESGLDVAVIAIGPGRNFDAVHREVLVAIADVVSRQTDHALDVVERRVFG